ncbi:MULTISPECIES: 4Fe-4S single cluster domain-containing protein [unclassified Pseudomonas]|jgi:anaerobic ribonucleoside-triphosphate reductase activating protein|uniref:4Fe-4S single cluster domain-containing protein n=1 Tax=unclassified Pseudomonas TaxID=196821 RepID=UPI000270C484|nr:MULTISPECIES: 4Fe-4S single cluster domain-containing protein [unclassified Pseudomonas]EJM78970.1 organic radical activating enzyme [Pseudomonas sp. GM67]MBD9545377.1 radical SAM protein [Pseudomonas sp. PDM01]
MEINVHHMELSSVNGPGLRLTLWVQGCALNCKGCFNQKTHAREASTLMPVYELAQKINALDIAGVTLSGGEPLDQAPALAQLIHAVNGEKNWILYTGYTPKEIFQNEAMIRVVKAVDLTLAGRYRHNANHPYQHKQIIKTSDRVDIDFFRTRRVVEFVVSKSGVTKTGLPMHV